MDCVQVVDISYPLIAVALSRIHLAKNRSLYVSGGYTYFYLSCTGFDTLTLRALELASFSGSWNPLSMLFSYYYSIKSYLS
jgi:hypothetical protein